MNKNMSNVLITVFSDKPLEYIKDANITFVNPHISHALIKILRTLFESDLLILGGGTLLDDSILIRKVDLSLSDILMNYFRAYLRIPFWLSKIIIFKIMRKPVMFYAQGIGTVSTRLGKFFTRIVVRQVDVITVRDEMSKVKLENVGVKSKIYVTADSAFNLEPTSKQVAQEILKKEKIKTNQRPLVGFSLRPWEKFNNWNTFTAVIDRCIEELGVYIVLISMHYGRDNDVLSKVWRKLKNKNYAKLISANYSPKEVKGIIGELDLMVGMRMHSLIFAAGANVPVIGISYMDKVNSFMKLVGLSDNCINLDDINSQILFDKIKRNFHTLAKINRELKIGVDKLKEKEKNNFKFVKGLLNI